MRLINHKIATCENFLLENRNWLKRKNYINKSAFLKNSSTFGVRCLDVLVKTSRHFGQNVESFFAVGAYLLSRRSEYFSNSLSKSPQNPLFSPFYVRSLYFYFLFAFLWPNSELQKIAKSEHCDTKKWVFCENRTKLNVDLNVGVKCFPVLLRSICEFAARNKKRTVHYFLSWNSSL